MSTSPEIQTIHAEKIFVGDYYTLPNGQQKQLFRKKDVYAFEPVTGFAQPKSRTSMRSVEHHKLGNMAVYRLDSSRSALKANTAELTRDGFPVFTNKSNSVDMVIRPELLIHFGAGINGDDYVAQLESDFPITHRRKIYIGAETWVHHYDYVLTPLSYDSYFATLRELTQEPYIRIAEPEIYSQPIRASAPTDNLFSEQWYLGNTGQFGGLCDADIDAVPAWMLDGVLVRKGSGITVAVVDDGVELNHPEYTIDSATAVVATSGSDFVDDSAVPVNCDDGTPAVSDNDASPHVSDLNSCSLTQGSDDKNDDHGTAIAGIIGARENLPPPNGGTVGVAPLATIYPVRLISDYGPATSCSAAASALIDAAQNAHIINASWTLDGCEGNMTLTDAITNIATGTVVGSPRSNGTLGTPLIFPTGNLGSGWKYFETSVSAGSRTFRWEYAKDDFSFFGFEGENGLWLDDISIPGEPLEDFNSGAADLTNFGTSSCEQDNPINAPGTCSQVSSCNNAAIDHSWNIFNQNPLRTLGGDGFSIVAGNPDSFDPGEGGSAEDCEQIQLTRTTNVDSGTVSFWYWISATQTDYIEFFIDGSPRMTDSRVTDEVLDIAFPASHPNTIAIGASGNGSSGELEYKTHYSQFGSEVDFVAPGPVDDDAEFATTDRTGQDNGYDSDSDYTLNFGAIISEFTSDDGGSTDQDFSVIGGTSASTAIVSGVIANVIAANNNVTSSEIMDHLIAGADKIGRLAYDDGETSMGANDGRNDLHGYGRVNLYKTLQSLIGVAIDEPVEECPIPEVDNSICFPIVGTNVSNTAVVCI
ncbi:MAG: S8 family serine peptidase [Pseudomonadota bacterium]